ncbi:MULTISPECIES: GTP-binding protein [unclassified Exiguobacterium]|uniref:flagellar biosynthesis protein FlhF n=1 Tax=unclassified Exiguobacterium TaxID=2644629 RepID=UPI00103D5AA9|nr:MULTISPECIES: GTP-binding protein [unclassified Exiguobacterium]TCI37337.1 GTP-binding protein [Exiguobacterium sp. SH4S7]TCI45467.1 GTP-binding protein [Exiguobacterium sp. SH5S32]TCI52668.1 GTP-binding protein [Exiguobacterium sp. SH1S4]TCI70857.1 GTP-binding protein [Exiguobacterium sp. SH1S1]
MQIKKYTGKTMSEVMAKVKQELGDEAVILNSRQVKKGWFGLFASQEVEVIAALEKAPLTVKPRTEPKLQPKQAKAKPIPAPTPTPQPVTPVPEKRRLPAGLTHIESLLASESFTNESWEERINELYYTTKSLEVVEQYVYDQIRSSFLPVPDALRYVMLVGPTGVGKTTTLAKLAAHYKLDQGMSVGLITTDTYRIAAIEQLKTYAEILNIPVEVAYDFDDFKRAKQLFARKDIVLIDTAGRNFRDEAYVEQFHNHHDFSETSLSLVLSLTSKMKDMDLIYRQFEKLPLRSLIFTKADETSDIHAMYRMVRESGLPVAWLTDGQEVPDDMVAGDPDILTQKMLEKEGWTRWTKQGV